VTEKLFNVDPKDLLETLSRDELLKFAKFYQAGLQSAVITNQKLIKENKDLRTRLGVSGEQSLLLNEKLTLIRHELYGASSERRRIEIKAGEESNSEPLLKAKKVQKPSLRYESLDLVESKFTLEPKPTCECCNHVMESMNQFEESEELDVIPKKFFIRKILREKYRCKSCHGSIVTAPGPEKLIKGGSYSTGVAIDIAEQKYAHHMPIERIKKQYQDLGLKEIEAKTLIEQTHHLAEKLRKVSRAIRSEVVGSNVLHADETPWRMLEGHAKKSWYLWAFGSSIGVYYEANSSRSSEGAERILKDSSAEFLMVDGYTGYKKAHREVQAKHLIAHCWAHARRKFIEAEKNDPRALVAIELIGKLYALQRVELTLPERLNQRKTESASVIGELRNWANEQNYLPKSSIGKAIEYLIKYWRGLTLFLNHAEVPLDNNFAERSLRGAVLGRKNFYGNHSERGAETSMIFYTVIETCKINHVPPGEYLRYVIQSLNNSKIPKTPYQYSIAE
jgi:transposase